MTGVVLIGCGATKLDHAAPAKDLYVGNLFRARRAYAEATGAPWAILSARHGLVLPDTVIEPYDVTLNGRKPEDVRRWRLSVCYPLRKWIVGLGLAQFTPPADWNVPGTYTTFDCHADVRIELHAGKAYVEPLLEDMPGAPWDLPMQGLGVGQQLGWYSKRRQLALAVSA